MSRKKLIHRIARVQGQLDSLRGLLEEDAPCDEVLRRSKTCKMAIESFSKAFLILMLRECLLHPSKSVKEKEKMLTAFEETMKNF